MTTSVDLRALARSDFPLVASWLAEPLVARWWNHESWPEALEREYGGCIDGREPTDVFIAALGAQPFGLVQRYQIAAYPEYVAELAEVCKIGPTALSIDYLIGEPALRGRGLGTATIASFAAFSWNDCPDAQEIVVPVSTANDRSWRALERAGFERFAEVELKPDNQIDSRAHVVYRAVKP